MKAALRPLCGTEKKGAIALLYVYRLNSISDKITSPLRASTFTAYSSPTGKVIASILIGFSDGFKVIFLVFSPQDTMKQIPRCDMPG